MQKFGRFIIVALAAIPLVYASNTLYPAINGETLFYRGVAFVAITIVFFSLLSRKDRNEVEGRVSHFRKNPIFIVLLVQLGLLILSTIFAHSSYIAFYGEPVRGEGFLTLFALYCLYLFLVITAKEKEWRYFFLATTVVSTILFIAQLWQWGHGAVRPSATIGNPIFLAGLYLFNFFAGYVLLREEAKNHFYRVAGIVGVSVSVLGIFLTETRGTLLALGAAALITGIIAYVQGKGKRIKTIAVRTILGWVIGVAVALSVVILVTKNAPVWQSVPGVNRLIHVTQQTETIHSRLLYSEVSLQGFGSNTTTQKLLGWGWDNYQFFWNKNYNPTVFFYDPNTVDRSHDKLTDILIMSGILGLLIYLSVWFLLLRQGLRIIKTQYYLGIGILFTAIAYFVHGLFAVDSPAVLFSFYWFLAFITNRYV